MKKINLFILFILLFNSCKDKSNESNSYNTPEKVSQKTAISFVKGFYSSYLTDLNENTTKCVLKNYLSEDLINSIKKLDYNPIIDAQDYNKFDLKDLKVSKTDNENVYRVKFINMGNIVITDVKVTQRNNSFLIVEHTTDQTTIPNNSNKNTTSDFDDYFSYSIEAYGDPRTAIEYIIEGFDSNTIIFKKNSYDDTFEYECTKQKKDNTLQLFHKTTIKGKDYNSNKPLITIYKKNNLYYAISPMINDGKEIAFDKK